MNATDGGSGRTSLSRRGWTVLSLTVTLWFLGATFGERSLNALVAPGALALLVAVAIVHRTERPTVDRVLPPDGFPGESGTVELTVEGGRAGTLTVADAIPQGLSADDPEHAVAGGSATVRHELHYDRRGAHEVGPVTVTVADLFGLATRTYEYPESVATLLVYPKLAEPPGDVLASLSAAVELQRRPGRDEFDRLREYDRGDAPRDIHWKSSAKRPDDELVVKEFLGQTPSDGVGIAVGGSGARTTIDALAEATASVAVHLLEEGVEVGLETPTASVEQSVGAHQRQTILATLARLDPGAQPNDQRQIRIQPVDGEATVAVGGARVPFRTAEGSEVVEREEQAEGEEEAEVTT